VGWRKPPEERGLYLHPGLYDQPEELGIGHLQREEQLRQLEQERQQLDQQQQRLDQETPEETT